MDFQLALEFPNSQLTSRPTAPFKKNGLPQYSHTEARIHSALERMGILFTQNAPVRLTVNGRRRTLQPDFLIIHKGRIGILEVDGAPFHPAERSAIEHRRDRSFKRSGIYVVERFDATDCYHTPTGVVEEFMQILEGRAA